MKAPDLSPLPSWGLVEPMIPRFEHRSFVSGEPEGDRLRVRYYVRPGDRTRLYARAWFGPGTEGPPGHAHGGSQAALLDEAMGGAAWLAGHPVVAATIATTFRRMLPLGTVAWLEAWVDGVQGRKVSTRARLCSGRGEPFSEGEGLFVELAPERFGTLAGEARAALGERG